MQVKLRATVFAQNINMALSRIFVFTTAVLVGICCQKVTYLSVKKAGSISIPCSYDSWQINNNKYLYLCKAPYWQRCKKVVETDQPSTSTKYSILDDKLQRVFNVTIRDLTYSDTRFLCWVSEWSKTKLSLQILSEPRLYVDEQSITAVLGGSVTVACHYAKKHQFRWCKFDGQCISTSGQMTNGMEVSINANKYKGATVTMKDLKQEHSGWYFCQNGVFQMPVNLTVVREVTTTAPTTTPFVPSVTQSTSEPSTTICTNTTIGSQPVNSSSAMTMEVNEDIIHAKSHIAVIMIASAAVLVLLLFVIAGFTALKMSLCRKRIPTESHTAEGPQTVTDQSVIYSNIFLTQEPSDNNKGPHTVTDRDVIYSTVVLTQKPSDNNKGPHTVTDPDVIYSNIVVTQEPSYNNKSELSEANVIYPTIVTQDKCQQMTRQAEESVIYSTVSK